MRPRCLMMVAVSLFIAADPVDDTKRTKDKLQGTWAVMSVKSNNPDLDYLFKDLKLIFVGDKLTFKHKSGIEEQQYRLDPSKQPNVIDLISDRALNKNKPLLGIYLLEGDDLKLCWSKRDGEDRPTAFAIKPGRARHVLLVLKREKPIQPEKK